MLDALSFFPDVVIDFVFDNCTDESVYYFKNHNIINTHQVVYFESDKKLRWPNTNDAIERFLKSDCDIFLSPQDDMKVQDKFILQNLENLYSRERNIGIVGMRDGIKRDKNQFYSSCHSRTLKTFQWHR